MQADRMQSILNGLRALIFHTNAIVEEEEAELIQVHIEAMEEIRTRVDTLFGIDRIQSSIKEDIRLGHGDLKKIQEKCIRLGLV